MTKKRQTGYFVIRVPDYYPNPKLYKTDLQDNLLGLKHQGKHYGALRERLAKKKFHPVKK